MVKAVYQRRWRRKVRAALLAAYGGFCGGGAPTGLGCGANGSTPLEFAHLRPTGLRGQARADRTFADIRRNPDAYALLCVPCHRAFDALEPHS